MKQEARDERAVDQENSRPRATYINNQTRQPVHSPIPSNQQGHRAQHTIIPTSPTLSQQPHHHPYSATHAYHHHLPNSPAPGDNPSAPKTPERPSTQPRNTPTLRFHQISPTSRESDHLTSSPSDFTTPGGASPLPKPHVLAAGTELVPPLVAASPHR